MLTYAIGDIHGQIGKLRAAHRRIAEDRRVTGDAGAPVIHLGDLVDRGPDSAGVVELLSAGIRAGEPWRVIKGNHDRLFTRFLDDPGWCDGGLRDGLHWFHPPLGGRETLASYDVDLGRGRDPREVQAEALARVPPAHRDFLRDLPLFVERGGAVYVHAGIRPGVPLAEQVEQDLIWIRSPFLEDPRDHGPLIVHGHTALPAAQHYGNRLNLDSGAGYGHDLSVAVLDGRHAWLLTDDGRVPLEPALA